MLLLIVAMAWLLKRLNAVPGSASQAIKIIGGLSLGPKEKVVLLEVGNKHILVGSAQGQISPLHVFDEPLALKEGDNNASTTSSPNFVEILSSLKPGDRS